MAEQELDKNFWREKTLEEMTPKEWEALCDRCGRCCLEKLKEDSTGITYETSVACRLLDIETGKCGNYENRQRYMNDCIKLTILNIKNIDWLPQTCSYKLVEKGEDLPAWHPLKTGNPDSAKQAGKSVSSYAIHPIDANKDWSKHITRKLP